MWRRDIHAHPELGFEETRTAGFVAEKLESFGLVVHRGIGRTGVVGVLRAGKSTRSVGLRAKATRGFNRDVMPAIADGRIAPVIDRVFAFDQLPLAKAYVESGAQIGKVVVRLD